ncbi:EscU/YscU/HrcU family type III secretion system export apparatus switch protein [Eubacteriales bacterium OttesenSCG-928-M02]|nr:EscU/YscU/HrcU family type III secretion system export apparatus switch protein [Eubacteriales bacterium OttesenSCG-928-M02]
MDDEKRQEDLKKAAALKYDAQTDDAPYIVGLGVGITAENMVKEAEEHDVPVVENQDVASALTKLGIGDAIPEELFSVVAEILVFIARVDGEQSNRFGLTNGR